jgi:uncharacterized protein involved in response to NO
MAESVRVEPPHALPVAEFALWQLGFRPFYLLASAFAAVSVALWALQMAGWLSRPYLAGPLWHAHEMLFGYALAVVVGFLLTAGKNWSGQPTLRGLPLALLAALWLAGRLLIMTPFAWSSALVNSAFPLASAAALAVPFWRARNRRNYFFVGLLTLLSLAQLAVHLSQMQVLALPTWLGIQVGLDVLLFIMAVMAGRVAAMFTNSGVPGATARRIPRLEKAALGLVLAILAADVLGPLLPARQVWMTALLGLAAVVHLARMALWQSHKTLRTPLVWILHVAYLWIVIHLSLRALAMVELVPASLATHALTVGAVGGLTIGMMTRTARGHTARPLIADGFEVAAYLLVLSAAAVRVLLPLLMPSQLINAWLFSALLWSLGFGLYTLRYWPVLSRKRLDGRPG